MGGLAPISPYKKVILGDDMVVATDEYSEHCIVMLYERLFDLINKGHEIKIVDDSEKGRWGIFYNLDFHFKVK